MDIPFDNPILKYIYWLLNTPGVGGIVVGFIGASLVLSYGFMVKWISDGDKSPEDETYTYPTPALHKQSKER